MVGRRDEAPLIPPDRFRSLNKAMALVALPTPIVSLSAPSYHPREVRSVVKDET